MKRGAWGYRQAAHCGIAHRWKRVQWAGEVRWQPLCEALRPLPDGAVTEIDGEPAELARCPACAEYLG